MPSLERPGAPPPKRGTMTRLQRRTLSVVLGAVLTDDAILLVRRHDPNIPEYDSFWELPGGKIEIGESQKDTAEREVWEETNVVVTAVSEAPFSYQALLDLKDPPLEVRVTCWICRARRERRNQDHLPGELESQWVPLDEVANCDIIPGSREFIAWALYNRGISSQSTHTLYRVHLESVDHAQNRRREYSLILEYNPREAAGAFAVTAQASRIQGQTSPPIVKHYNDFPSALDEVRTRIEKRQKHGYFIVEMPDRHPLRSWIQARGLEFGPSLYPTLPLG